MDTTGTFRKESRKFEGGGIYYILPGKVVAAETVDKFKLELDMYLEVMEIEGYRDVDRTFR